MPIEITTVYDKKKILQTNDYHAKHQVVLWLSLGAFTLFCVGWFICDFLFNATINLTSIFLMLIYNGVGILSLFGVARININKNRDLDTVVKYSFGDGSFEVEKDSKTAKSRSTVSYSGIVRVGSDGYNIYLYIGRNAVYTVDVSGLTIQQLTELKELLEKNIDAKKIKW